MTLADVHLTARRFGEAMVSKDIEAALDVIAKKSAVPGGKETIRAELERAETLVGKAGDFDILEVKQVQGTRRLFYIRMVTYHVGAPLFWEIDLYAGTDGPRMTGCKFTSDIMHRDVWK